MPIPVQDILLLEHDAIVELFELDLNAIGVSSILRFCNYQVGATEVSLGGQAYSPFPLEASGFEYNGRGMLPRPQITLSNVQGVTTALILQNQDIVGAKFTRKRTLAKYLDGGSAENSGMQFEPDIYYVDRKVSETKIAVTFELASILDLEGLRLPARVMIANTCTWEYRLSGCGYAGGPVADEFDNPTSDPSQDECSRTVDGCRFRFGAFAELPYGGFPGLDYQR